MNTSHYPSLELCKKLTEAGFPITVKVRKLNMAWYQAPQCLHIPIWYWVCPSVMELLDEMPNFIQVKYKDWDVWNYKLEIGRQWASKSREAYYVHYVEWTWAHSFMLWTLPNALAEMWLWLKENNYLSKK